MKYQYPTISKPVTGEKARSIIEAVDSGSHVANPRALEVMRNLYERFRDGRVTEGKRGTGKIRRN